jgi:aspartyl-tRNA(Asn)/glutamyl-tRNA(Gln) amidotransferase subunit C
MAISRDEVLHVARLARLELTDDEVERFREQLNAILEAVGKVSELDLADVEQGDKGLQAVNVQAV